MEEIKEIIKTLQHETGININQVINILEFFFNSTVETKKTFDIHVNLKDCEAVCKQAHQIKGTAANLRLPQIKEYAELIESVAKKCDIDLCKQYMSELMEHLEILKHQISLYKSMKKFNILIVEDSFMSGNMLEQIIINLGHHSLGIVSSAEKTLLSVKKERPDIIFMDIDLSTEMDGMHLAKLLYNLYYIPIVFISIHADQAIIKKAKNYGIGYIVKPFMPEEIEEMINLASKNIIVSPDNNESNQTKLKVKDDNRIFFIDFYDVICFESRLHKILIYTGCKTYELRKSLKAIKLLDNKNYFIQPHRSFLVNRNYIEELINEDYNYFLKLKSLSDLIPVSRANVKMIKEIC